MKVLQIRIFTLFMATIFTDCTTIMSQSTASGRCRERSDQNNYQQRYSHVVPAGAGASIRKSVEDQLIAFLNQVELLSMRLSRSNNKDFLVN